MNNEQRYLKLVDNVAKSNNATLVESISPILTKIGDFLNIEYISAIREVENNHSKTKKSRLKSAKNIVAVIKKIEKIFWNEGEFSGKYFFITKFINNKEYELAYTSYFPNYIVFGQKKTSYEFMYDIENEKFSTLTPDKYINVPDYYYDFDEHISLQKKYHLLKIFQNVLNELAHTTIISDDIINNYKSDKIKVAPEKENKEISKSFPKLDIIKGDDDTLKADSTNYKIYYAIVPYSQLIPSNNPFTFAKNDRFIDDCQSRDYSQKEEQYKIINNAKNYNAKFVITDDPTGVNGSPIITTDGIVLGGNSRTMTIGHLIENGTYDELYKQYLIKRLSIFGLEDKKSEIEAIKNPILVRVLPKFDYKDCSKISAALQDSETKKMNIETNSIAQAKKFTQEQLNKLANLLIADDTDSFSTIYTTPAIRKDIIKILTDADIIKDSNRPEWLAENNEFTDQGKLLFTNLLAAVVLNDKESLTAVPSYTKQVARALPNILKMISLPEAWNLVPNIKEAITLENRRRKSNAKSIEEYLNQTSLTDDPKNVSEKTKNVWKALFYEKPSAFNKFIGNWVTTALNQLQVESGNAFDWDKEKLTPEKVLDIYVSRGLNGIIEDTYNGIEANTTLNGEINNAPVKIGENFGELDTNNILPANVEENIIDSGLAANVVRPDLNEDVNALPKLMTTKEISNTVLKDPAFKLKLSTMNSFLPGLLSNANLLVQGPPGAGKSTLVLKLMNDLAQNGDVLFVSAEEKTVDTRMQERLKRNNITAPNIYVLENRDYDVIKDFIKSGKYQFIVIDSHNEIHNSSRIQKDLTELMKTMPEKSFTVISRVDKTGKHILGSSDWGYDVDTVISLENGTATTKKHRDGEAQREFRVFPSKAWDSLKDRFN